jgi:hypothetical protein
VDEAVNRVLSQEAVFESQEQLVLTETIGSVLWFIMDGFWMLNYPLPAKAMAFPTLVVNLLVFRYTKRSFGQIAVVGAMNSWLLMNISWMLSDLDKDPRLLTTARVMFGVGIALLALAVGRNVMHPQGLTAVLARFRRLRM